MKKIKLTYIFIMISILLTAQVKEITSADKLFEIRDYTGAIQQYKKALRKTSELQKQQEIAYRIAMSYYYMNEYGNASDWLEDAIGDHVNDPVTYINYSLVLSAEKKYDQARAVLKEALSKYPDNKEIGERIYAINLIIDNGEDTTGILSKVKEINSEYSDYGPGYWQDGIVFASTRKSKSNERTDGRTGQGFSDLYFSDFNFEKKEFESPSPLSSKINSSNNEGSFSYDNINHIAYWTKCTSKPDNCLIYSSTYSYDTRKWSKPEKVEFMNEGYDYGHPFINKSGDVLYFTSNMPGGYGNNDLWKVKRKSDGYWGVPVNLGREINTSRNELFPTIYGDSLLFFASDNIDSYGGLDIYFSLLNGIRLTNPTNLGLPLNSAADDFGLLMRSNSRGGFITSNRDLETSDDIYRFSGFPIKIVLEGYVYHEADSKPIKDAMIIYIDDNDIQDTVFTDSEGFYKIMFDAYNIYRLMVSKENYFNHEQVFSTKSSELIFKKQPQLVKDFYLSRKSYPCGIAGVVTNRETEEPMMSVLVSLQGDGDYSSFVKTDFRGAYSFDGLKPNKIYTVKTGKDGYFSESRVVKLPQVKDETIFSKRNGYDLDFRLLKIQTKTEITLSNIYYDLNKATLRETSKIELNKLASMIKETPGIKIQINAHTDATGRADYNMKLSARRANSVVDYLVSKGVDRSRLIAKGYGETMLLIENATSEDEHQANRRTTFSVVDAGNTADIIEVEPEEMPTAEVVSQEKIVVAVKGLKYHIQLITTGSKRNTNKDFSNIIANIEGIRIIELEYGTLWKYEADGAFTHAEAIKLKDRLKWLGYDDCFIVSYYNGAKIPVDQAKIMEEENR